MEKSHTHKNKYAFMSTLMFLCPVLQAPFLRCLINILSAH